MVVENVFTVSRVHQAYLGPHCCVAWPDDTGRLQRAINPYSEARDLTPSSPINHLRLARTLFDAGLPQEDRSSGYSCSRRLTGRSKQFLRNPFDHRAWRQGGEILRELSVASG